MNIYTIVSYSRKVNVLKPRYKGEVMLDNSSEILVEAENEKEALLEAKKMLKRKGYRIAKVWKKDEFHDEVHVLQLEMQKQMLDLAKGKR